MSCGKAYLEGDLILNCGVNGGIGGLEVNATIINRKDIDLTSVTFSPTNPMVMTGFALKAGRTGFLLPSIKQTNVLGYEDVPKEKSVDKCKHTLEGLIFTLSAENKQRINEMRDGSFVIVVEKKWKGVDSLDAFDVYGFHQGMKSTTKYLSNENDGGATISIASEDNYEELTIPYTLLLGDYTATKTVVDNKFIQA